MRPLAPFAAAGAVLAVAAGLYQVRAADLDPIFPAPPVYAEPDTAFTFGSGWYLRGDASFQPADHPVLDLADPGFQFNKRDWDYALGGGLGYKFNSFLRADITGDYFAPVSTRAPSLLTGGAADFSRATLRRYDGLANLYVDLGTWYGLTPYIGGGVGFRVFDPSAKVAYTNANGGTSLVRQTVGSETKLAWAAMAGVSYDAGSGVAVDVGYRHLDLGRFSATLVGYSIDHHFTEDQVRVGLRYAID